MDELINRYLPSSTPECPTFVDDSEWRPIIDGAEYCRELADALDELQHGDAVAVIGLEVSPDFDLRGRAPTDQSACPLAEQLAQAALRGVEVRILVAGKTAFGIIPPRFLGPFARNASEVARLRSWQPRGSGQTPLADKVALDFSGPKLGSNHQKVVVLQHRGNLTGYVGGVDLVPTSRDAAPHDSMRLRLRRWGWHDLTVRLRGPAASRVWDEARRRWLETRALPERHDRRVSLRHGDAGAPLNPPTLAPALAPVDAGQPCEAPGVAVRVLRSVSRTAVDSWLPSRRAHWSVTPVGGYQEIFETLTAAIGAARRYIYIEDQYLEESLGASPRYELYPHLLAAAQRGVKLIFVGSGVRDPEDIGPRVRRINRRVTADIRRKIVQQLPLDHRDNVGFCRIEHATVHSKLVMIDDVFANIGSANMFARSMSGVDCELSTAVVTSTALVRDLRVALWAEHLRAPLTSEFRAALENLDLALGIWRREWLPAGAAATTWQQAEHPAGFHPAERVLTLVGP